MTRVLAIAVAALLLSVGASFAEPPMSVDLDHRLVTANQGIGQLTDAEMRTMEGTGFWSGACSTGLKLVGIAAVTYGLLGQSHLAIASGQVLIAAAPGVCV